MHLMMPVVVWLALRAQKNQSVKLWVVGGEIFGLGLLSMSLRGHTPDWLSHEASNFCLYFGYMLRIQSLKTELHDEMKWSRLVLITVVMCLGYVIGRQVFPHPRGHFIWSAVIIAMQCLWISHLSRRIALRDQLHAPIWLANAYLPLAVLLLVRAAQVAFDTAQAGLLVDDFIPMAIALTGIFSAVMGNTSFLGMFAERSSKRQLQHAQDQARREESARLGRQIAQLDRQRGMGMLAASLAHELSQPLTNISLMTDLIRLVCQRKGVTDAGVLQHLDAIHDNVKNAVEVMQRARSFITPQDLEHQNVVLQDVVQRAIRLMTDWFRTEHVQLHVSVPEYPIAISGDPVQIAQILVNLLRNAVQSTAGQASRQVTLSLSSEGVLAILEVKDNGPGFRTEVLETTTGTFFTTKSDGLGVGLSISRHIAELHDGSIALSNATEGGASVSLRLPMVSSEATGKF